MPLLVGRVDGQRVLVDGRNRREACRRAGIVPNYTLLSDGEDLSARILSENVHRRHLTKGQRAIVVAQLTRNWSVRKVAGEMNQKRELIRQARFVLRYGPDLADSVLSGALSLDNAYEEARIRKGRADTYESRFNALKAAAPDLAEMVVHNCGLTSSNFYGAWHSRCRPRGQLAGRAPTAREGNQPPAQPGNA